MLVSNARTKFSEKPFHLGLLFKRGDNLSSAFEKWILKRKNPQYAKILKWYFIGLQDRLSYLVELGVDVLWLSPIQATSSISAQDVENFEKLKEIYGMRQDLADLISTAKALGIYQTFKQKLVDTSYCIAQM